MPSVNILFTSAGRRVSLVRLFREALANLGVPGRLVTADAKTTAPARFVADAHELVPRVDDASYVDRLLEICRAHQIGLLVPLIDSELLPISERQEEFKDAGTLPLVSTPEVNRICLDKRLTHDFFRGSGILTPALFDPDTILADPTAKYPYMFKPACGSASVGVTRIENARQLEFFAKHVPDAILQELVAGREFTLDIMCDFEGRVRCVVPRLRIETRAGEVSKGLTVKDAAIMAAGQRVAEALPGALGCITPQCIVTTDGTIKFIEINPRFGGGFPLSAAAGANFPSWILEQFLGRSPRIEEAGWQDGLMMIRYDEAVFVPRRDVGW